MSSDSTRHGWSRQIIRNRRTFDFAVKRAEIAHRNEAFDDAAGWCSVAASFAWHSHPGIFTDETIRRILRDIGRKIDDCGRSQVSSYCRSTQIDDLSVLHVMTSANPVGGHTRAVSRWIRNSLEEFPKQKHSLTITHQGSIEVPRWLLDAVRESGGECWVIPSGLSLVQIARKLRTYSAFGFDLVVSHVNPDDPVSTIAFSAKDFEMPVILFNHADHVFSLATSEPNVILDFRPSGKRITETLRRGKGRSMLLPIPLVDPMKEFGAISFQKRKALREEARIRLGLGKDQPIALTIGVGYRYKPALGRDFLRTSSEILSSVTTAHVFAIGLPKMKESELFEYAHNDRFHACGAVDDSELRDHLLAADVFLEIFPFTSLTAMLEGGLYGLPMQRMRNEEAPILSGDDISLESVVPTVLCEEDYAEGAVRLLLSSAETRHEMGQRIRDRILADHCGASWGRRWLEPAVNAATCRNNVAIDATLGAYEEEAASDESIQLAEWDRNLFACSLIDSIGLPYQLSPKVKGLILLYSLIHFGSFLQSYLKNYKELPIKALTVAITKMRPSEI